MTLTPFRCNLVIEVLDGDAATIPDAIELYRVLRGLRHSGLGGRCIEAVTSRYVAPPNPVPPPAEPKPRRRWTRKHDAEASKLAAAASRQSAEKPKAKRKSAVGGRQSAAAKPEAAKPPRLCEHCNEPLRPHAPGKSRFCSRPECKKARQNAAYHRRKGALAPTPPSPPEPHPSASARAELIRKRHLALKSHNLRYVPDNGAPGPDDDPTPRELDRAAKSLGSE